MYNKTSFKLKQQYVLNPEEEWIRCDGAYTPVISLDKFKRANEIIRSRAIRLSEEELLEKLHTLLKKRGRLSGIIIDEEERFPSSSVYRYRFGSLLRVYHLIGYTPETDYSWLETNKFIKNLNAEMTNSIIGNISNEGGWISDASTTGVFHINDEFTLSIQTSRCRRTGPNSLRWKINFNYNFSPDINIAVRMDSTNQAVVDYYIFPAIDIISQTISLKETNPYCFDLYRFDNLSSFYRLIRRIKLQEL
ncbi:recombinase family protein [Serratia nevei]|nr:recombinase family protein [Serratia nevei]